MAKMFEKFIENRKRKIQAKKQLLRQAMKSEIINAIQKEVQEEQTGDVNIPNFVEIQSRINALGIVTQRDLIKVYSQFAKQGKVSGVLNV